ncbi:MAG: hypothetical protein PHQ95_03445 [Candidatus Gracilibacteria bacterium]|nr:hypothetical protein [Candidatus Gracilibacteria bacterium]
MNEQFTYEVFPRRIEDETFLLASIKTDMNGLVNIKAEYTFKYLLFRNETGIYLKQYISSNSEAGISFLLNFYEKLYSGSIAFKKINDPLLLHRSKHHYTVALKNNNVFQIKKPGEIGLNTFSSSTGLIENVLNEASLVLKQGEFIQFEFKIIPSTYDQFTKAFLYAIKEIGKSEEYKEELNSSFTDKLGFFIFDLRVCHNLDNEKVFGEILYKNLRLYDSNWNYYEYKYSNKDYPKIANRYKKGQMDMFLSHGLVSLISENNRYVKKLPSSIIPISPTLALNNGTGKKKGEYKTFIGKGFRDLRLNNQEYLSIDEGLLKNGHFLGIGSTGTGKSYSTSSVMGYDIVKSIIDDRLNFEKNESPRSQHIFIDPHYSLAGNIYKILEVFNKDRNFKYNSELQITEYQKNNDNQPSLNSLSIPLKKTKLVFNPLYSGSLNMSNPIECLKDINRMVSACLDGVRATHSKTSFGPQNSEILGTIIRLFIIFNVLRNEANKQSNNDTGNYKRMLNLGDIHDFLEDMEISKSLPDQFKDDFKEGLTHKEEEIRNIIKNLKKRIDYYLEQLKKNAGYLSSSINKVSPYSMELKETFGSGTLHTNYSLNLSDFYIKKDYEKTNVFFFNLGDFSINEKNIVAGFILSYMYHYGTIKNHLDKKNLVQTKIWIDEASAILNGEYILEIIASSLAEIRKYNFSLKFFAQTMDQHFFSLVYPNVGALFVFSVDYRQAELILKDLNSGCSGKLLQPNDISNNQRGCYYGFLKFINGGNATFLVEGFSMNEEEIKYLIS